MAGAAVDLEGGGGFTGAFSNSPSFVATSCTRGKDALSPAGIMVVLEKPILIVGGGASQPGDLRQAGAALGDSAAARVVPPTPFFSSGVPATRVLTEGGAVFADALLRACGGD